MFSNDRNIETIGQLVESLKRYVGLQTEYVKLNIVEKVVRLLTVVTMTIVLGLLAIIALIYLSFAVAYALAPVMGHTWAFVTVSAVYIVAFIICILYRHRWIERPLVRFLASIFMDNSAS